MEELILFPAIDLKDGNCVRLYKGDMDQAKIFNASPSDQAKTFEQQGFKWLHLVDLNGAFEGYSVNKQSIEKIRSAVNMPIQLGGGIRTLEHIDHWLSLGINRVILGTVALENPNLVKEACKAFPDQIIVGMDARNANIAVSGWAKQSNRNIIDLAKEFEDSGVSSIIYTDIERDGALMGINIDSTEKLAKSVSIPVIASGGLRDYDDLRQLRQKQNSGIMGVISGKALYEKTIEAEKALTICREDFS